MNKNLISKIVSINDTCLGSFVVINNNYLIIGSGDGNLRAFNIQNKTLIKSEKEHQSNVLGIKLIKDKKGKTYLLSH